VWLQLLPRGWTVQSTCGAAATLLLAGPLVGGRPDEPRLLRYALNTHVFAACLGTHMLVQYRYTARNMQQAAWIMAVANAKQLPVCHMQRMCDWLAAVPYILRHRVHWQVLYVSP
jgi:hypothetical protein